ncbi:hypothetical protein GO988_12355 [Hymenobacter sp. HMF4947]|uniref:Uncharacterized protein n=1 Tax=Hymenobacter ginkgonis TaxID=2682976 RepID=A0A7K1TFC8_9BACT|nr:hypothetical protein [Hymenobacter ginkgonis]MVN77119.1 hypothetical protein [Hymenobacter ginkgonis]
MTFSAFKDLHQRRQAEHLAHHGRPLAERTEDSFRLSLYAVENFYAEVWRSIGEEAILFIHVFERPSGLADYLALVRLPAEW